MIINCIERDHEVFESGGYRVCMELGCPDHAVKMPHKAVSKVARDEVRRHKKNRRRAARIEEWELFEGGMFGDHILHWMANPYRRWYTHVLFVPAYIVCVVWLFIFMVGILCTADWG